MLPCTRSTLEQYLAVSWPCIEYQHHLLNTVQAGSLSSLHRAEKPFPLPPRQLSSRQKSSGSTRHLLMMQFSQQEAFLLV